MGSDFRRCLPPCECDEICESVELNQCRELISFGAVTHYGEGRFRYVLLEDAECTDEKIVSLNLYQPTYRHYPESGTILLQPLRFRCSPELERHTVRYNRDSHWSWTTQFLNCLTNAFRHSSHGICSYRNLRYYGAVMTLWEKCIAAMK